jgi:hypothetical protein
VENMEAPITVSNDPNLTKNTPKPSLKKSPNKKTQEKKY